MNTASKRILAVAVPLTAVAVSGVAFAAWTTSGSGQATATSKAAQNVTFATGSTTSAVYPLGKSDIVTTATNPNDYNVVLSGWSLTAAYDTADPNYSHLGGAGTQPTDISGTCGLSLGTVPPTVVLAHGSNSVTITNGLNMSNAASNIASTCANKTFTLVLAASSAASTSDAPLTTVTAS